MRKIFKITITIVAAVVWFIFIIILCEEAYSKHTIRRLTCFSLIILYIALRAIWGNERLKNDKKNNTDSTLQD